jgi:L-amino acid N-acyltransferase YncA
MVEIVDSRDATRALAEQGRQVCLPVGHPSSQLPLLIATSDGEFIGCAALIQPSQCTTSKCAGVNVEMLPENRRQGIGEELVRTLMARARGLGYERVQALIRQDNLPSVRLFEKIGFEPAGKQETEVVRLERTLA